MDTIEIKRRMREIAGRHGVDLQVSVNSRGIWTTPLRAEWPYPMEVEIRELLDRKPAREGR